LLIHCETAGSALIQQLIGSVEQLAVLVPDIQRMARGIDGGKPTAAMRAGNFFALIFSADFQRPAADGAFL